MIMIDHCFALQVDCSLTRSDSYVMVIFLKLNVTYTISNVIQIPSDQPEVM